MLPKGVDVSGRILERGLEGSLKSSRTKLSDWLFFRVLRAYWKSGIRGRLVGGLYDLGRPRRSEHPWVEDHVERLAYSFVDVDNDIVASVCHPTMYQPFLSSG